MMKVIMKNKKKMEIAEAYIFLKEKINIFPVVY